MKTSNSIRKHFRLLLLSMAALTLTACPDEPKGNNNGDDPQPTSPYAFKPYVAIEEDEQKSAGERYRSLFTLYYGGSNTLTANVKAIGINVTCTNGSFDARDSEDLFFSTEQEVRTASNENLSFSIRADIYATMDSPAQISVEEYWIDYSGNKTVEEPVVITIKYDAEKDITPSKFQPEPPVQPGTSGSLNGHDWVDLGLSVKWATLNLGADDINQMGYSFQWGSTEPVSDYLLDHYWQEGFSSYNSNIYINNISNSGFDAAKELWGDGWRMPTVAEIKELMSLWNIEWDMEFNQPWGDIAKCWVEIDGVHCVRLCGSTGQTLFLPAELSDFIYWTSEKDTAESEDNKPYGKSCEIIPKRFVWRIMSYPGYRAAPIRPVCD